MIRISTAVALNARGDGAQQDKAGHSLARIFAALALLAALVLAVSPATARSATAPRPSTGQRIIKVGPDEKYASPSQAAEAARPGDRIEIAAGTYHDCAIWRAGNLTIVGIGEVILAGTTCQEQAIFVTLGNDITVRGITFVGARVPNHNGAGIRADGANLTVEKSKFIDNEGGILSSPRDDSTIIIRDSLFKGNGTCESACAHGIYIGRIRALLVERSEFVEQHIGHQVKSRALRTELIDNVIRDGPSGNSSYLVNVPNGGTLVMRRNILEKGPQSDNPGAAIVMGDEGATNVTHEILIEDNTFTNRMGRPTLFVRNLTATVAVLQGNRLAGDVHPLVGPGIYRASAKTGR
jgi:hypothetical protein